MYIFGMISFWPYAQIAKVMTLKISQYTQHTMLFECAKLKKVWTNDNAAVQQHITAYFYC